MIGPVADRQANDINNARRLIYPDLLDRVHFAHLITTDRGY